MSKRLSYSPTQTLKTSKPFLEICKENTTIVAIIAIFAIVIISCVVLYKYNEGFAGAVNNALTNIPFMGPSIKELDVILFYSPLCPWSQKMIDVLTKENTLNDIKLIDITAEDGLEIAKKYGAVTRGTPNFISKKLSVGSVGYRATTGEVIAALKGKGKGGPHSHPENGYIEHGVDGESHEGFGAGSGDTPSLDPNEVKDLGIVLFFSETCPWCKKAKADADRLGLTPFLELQDLNNGGNTMIQNLGLENKGVPMMYSHRTRKVSVGYKPWNEVVSALR